MAGREARPREGGAFRRSLADIEASGRAGVADSADGGGVPWYTRSRGGNPSTGTVLDRDAVGVINKPGSGMVFYPSYNSYGGNGTTLDSGNAYWSYWYTGLPTWRSDCLYFFSLHCYGTPWHYGAYGLGYFLYDPSWWSYGLYSNSRWSAERSGGEYSGFPYGAEHSGAANGPGYGRVGGSIRLKVKPSNASIYIDGYFAGQVHDFDGIFQKLPIALGVHRIEISAPGYRPLILDVDIRNSDTVTHEGKLEPIR